MIKNSRGLLVGVPCFLLGNGPSLNDNDLAAIQDYFMLGINRIYKKTDCSLIIFQDPEILNDKGIFKTKAIKFAECYNKPSNQFYKFRLNKKSPFRHTASTKQLFGSGATGPLAFQVAVCLGCNPIVLLGMDCKYRDKKTNFYGKNKFHLRHSMTACRRGLQWMKNNPENRTIINCSDNGFWPQVSLEEAMQDIDPKWDMGQDVYRGVLARSVSVSVIRNIANSSGK